MGGNIVVKQMETPINIWTSYQYSEIREFLQRHYKLHTAGVILCPVVTQLTSKYTASRVIEKWIAALFYLYYDVN